MFIYAVMSLDLEHDFNGTVGTWRVRIIKEIQRTKAHHQRENEYHVETTIESEWHRD